MLQAAVAANEFSAVAGKGSARIIHIEEGNPVGKLGVVAVTRKYRTAVGIDFAGHMHGRLRPQIAQYPFHIAGR